MSNEAIVVALFVLVEIYAVSRAFGWRGFRRYLSLRAGHDPASPPEWRMLAATSQHESDRAWRLAEWNDARPLPKSSFVARRYSPSDDDAERMAELRRWNRPQ